MDLRVSSAPADPVCVRLVDDVNLTLLLDLDGTLIPFAATTEQATLDDAAITLLRSLHEAAVQVVIVSGRPQHLVAPLRPLLPQVWLAAEHGTWGCAGEGWRGPADSPELDDLTELLQALAQTPGARLEPKSWSLCLHWRMVPPALKEPLIRGATLICDEWLESHPEFERIPGVEMLEVRRRTANKGNAVAWVRARRPLARCIAIGDDATDDDMFAALRSDELAIGVGPRPSLRISRRLADPAEVRAFLRWIVEARTGHATSPFPALQWPIRIGSPTLGAVTKGPKKRDVRITLRMPDDLAKLVQEAADADRRSLRDQHSHRIADSLNIPLS